MITKTTETEHEVMVHALVKDGQEIINGLDPLKAHVMHMAIGVSGEAGELLDAVKKHVIYGQALNRENVIEELGDLEFYLRGLRDALVIDREHVLRENIRKLSVRYGTVYSDRAAQERKDKA